MRIGFFTDRYLPQIDGVIYSIESFRTEMEKMGHEVIIFAPSPGLRYKEKHKNVIRFPAVKGLISDYDYLFTLYFPPQAMRLIAKQKLDVIHFHTPGQIGLLGAYYAIKNHVPLVQTYHTDLYEYVLHYPQLLPGTIAISLLSPLITGGGLRDVPDVLSTIRPQRNIDHWNQKIVRDGMRRLNGQCDLVICPSYKMKHQLAGWHSKTRLEVLPTGVDEIATTQDDISSARKLYGIPKSNKVILFVGRLGPEKNISLLVEAFDIVARKLPEAHLVLAGDGPMREVLQAMVSHQPYASRVSMSGFIDRSDLGALYRIADVFAFPSVTDTQGLVINEAAQVGVPIVLVDREISEVAKPGHNALVAKNNAKDLASKLIHLLEDNSKREAYGKVSAELADEFTPPRQAEKLLRLYQEVIEQHAHPKKRKRWPSFRNS